MTQLFISYSRKHPVYADFLIEDLERDGYTSWLDRADIIGGDSWRTSIYNGIDNALVVLLIVTEEVLHSEVIKEEIAYAISKSKPCLPLFMQRLDVESTLKTWNLQHAQAIDFVADRRKEAYRKLLLSLQTLTDTWTPLAKLIDRLNHFSPKVRQEAAEKLGASEDIRVLESLIEAINVEPENAVQKSMLWQLHHFPTPRSIALAMSIANANKANNPGKHTAIRVLGEIGMEDPKVTDLLLYMLNTHHSKPSDTIVIAEALCRAPDEELRVWGINALIKLLTAPDTLRSDAIAILGKSGDPRAIAPLEKLLSESESDDDTRQLVRQALAILRNS